MSMPTEAEFDVAVTAWGPVLEVAQRERRTLVIALASKAMVRGLDMRAFEAETGLQHGYIGRLAYGHHKLEHLRDNVVQSLATFMGWPAIVVKAMAGKILLADFYIESELTEQPALMASRLDAPGLKDVGETVAVFAGVLACLDTRKRKAIRDVCADGPPERH